MKSQVKTTKQHATYVITGNIFDFLGEPCLAKGRKNYRFLEHGALLIENGKIADYGDAKDLLKRYPSCEHKDFSHDFIMPGFIDSHIHFPQLEMVASYGESLLTWLEKYTFPIEEKYSKKAYAQIKAQFFMEQLLQHGTTSAFVYPSSHEASVEVLFRQADEKNMRLVSGLVLMDQNAPPSLLTPYEQARDLSEKLIETWHHKNRLQYALTPRFAPTSSEAQLKSIRDLKERYPDVYLQTHLAENKTEVKWVKEIFKHHPSYTDIYHHFGLIDEKAIFAHCIYLSQKEWELMAQCKGVVSHCPSSNLFLGSGLFEKNKPIQNGVPLSLGSDIGAGTSCSMLQTLQDAYKVSSLVGDPLDALTGFYLLTLGGARAIKLDSYIGNFEVGKEADFLVLDPSATDILKERSSHTSSLEELLFCFMILGDDRLIRKTYVYGQEVYSKE